MKKLSFVLFACFFLTSCGKTLTVNLAETALVWRVDDFFDITQEQRVDLKKSFRQALKTVNDEYVPRLEKVILANDLVSKDCVAIAKNYSEIKPELEDLRIRFTKMSYPFIDSVSAEQISYFIENASSEISLDEKKSKADRVAGLEKRADRTQKTMEELFGDLSISQEQAIRAHVLGHRNLEELMVASRKKNLQLLQSKTEADAKSFMKDYIVQWRQHQTPELRAALVEREGYNEKFYMSFFCQSSSAQKKHFQKTVSEYLGLFRKVYIFKS